MTIAGITVDAAVLWLIAVAVLAVTEAFTLGLTSIWFAGGALLAAITAILGGSVAVQVIVFFVASAAMLAIMRPIVRKRFNNKIEKTNVDAIIGMEGVVEDTVTHINPGAVKVGGKVWTAVCDEDAEILPGTVVVVSDVRGVTLIVKKIEGGNKE